MNVSALLSQVFCVSASFCLKAVSELATAACRSPEIRVVLNHSDILPRLNECQYFKVLTMLCQTKVLTVVVYHLLI